MTATDLKTQQYKDSQDENVSGMQERKIGGTTIRVYQRKLDIDDIMPNERQPRLGSKIDVELQRQIQENEGIFEPLLLEPHPDLKDKYRIIDGERRWTNAKILVEKHGREELRLLPVEIINRVLTEDERLRVWIYIHRQRKEWDAKEKEMVAYRLVDLQGPASAANILGISLRELDKLVDIFEISERFTGLKELGAGITWARELMGISKNLITPEVKDAVIEKANQRRITSSKDLRKLRQILKDPVAKDYFLSNEGDIDSAMLRLGQSVTQGKRGLAAELHHLNEIVKNYPWSKIAELSGDDDFLITVRETKEILSNLERTLSNDKN